MYDPLLKFYIYRIHKSGNYVTIYYIGHNGNVQFTLRSRDGFKRLEKRCKEYI